MPNKAKTLSMNKFILSFIIGVSTLIASNTNAQDCGNFHKKKCYGSDNPLMTYNSQSKSGMFVLGHTSDLVFVAHAGHDYRVSLCQDKNVEEPLKFKIIDGRSKEVLFDNETAVLDTPADEAQDGDNTLPQYFDFSSETTKKIIIRITAPGPPPEEGKKASDKPNPEDLFCVGVLLESMATPSLGF